MNFYTINFITLGVYYSLITLKALNLCKLLIRLKSQSRHFLLSDYNFLRIKNFTYNENIKENFSMRNKISKI
jgi:hypothetical protein